MRQIREKKNANSFLPQKLHDLNAGGFLFAPRRSKKSGRQQGGDGKDPIVTTEMSLTSDETRTVIIIIIIMTERNIMRQIM